MKLSDHLRELRRRVFWSLLGIGLASVAGWMLYPTFFAALSGPLDALESRGQVAALNFGAIGSAFDLQIRVALVLGLFLASPWWVWQLFAFVAPGLQSRERLYTLIFGFLGAVLFICGGLLGWLILPNAVSVLTAFTPEGGLNLMDARVYFAFVVRIIVVFAIAFLVPLVLVGANMLGAVSGKALARGWRWWILISFGFAAVANPLPDAWSMIAMAAPICILYFSAIGVAVLNDKRRSRSIHKSADGNND